MNNEQVAELFVNNMNIIDGGAKGKNFFFENNVLYSYGRHYPLAIKLFDGERVDFLVNPVNYSVTTDRHRALFTQAASGYTHWLVPGCAPERIHEHIEENMSIALRKIGPAKGKLFTYIEDANYCLDKYIKFCERFEMRAVFTPLFSSMDPACRARMRKGSLYTGRSDYKLFREFSDILKITETLSGGA